MISLLYKIRKIVHNIPNETYVTPRLKHKDIKISISFLSLCHLWSLLLTQPKMAGN